MPINKLSKDHLKYHKSQILFQYQLHLITNQMKILFIFCFVIGLVHLSPLDDTVTCIHSYINSFQKDMNPTLFRIFKNAFPNTLQTTIQHYNLTKNYQQTYIITGDIKAMWLRDSTNQFLPYIRMKTKCPNMESLSKGLINTQAQFIMIDGYTNAFKRFQTDKIQRPWYLNDKSQKLLMGIPIDLCRYREFATQAIWERKFKIDSLASFLRLASQHYKTYNNLDFVNLKFIKALKIIVKTLQQQKNDESYQKQNNSTFYTFFRDAKELPKGKISPSKKTGMVKTGFRPSDDANQLPFNIAGNAMASTFLKKVAENILSAIPNSSVYYSDAMKLKQNMIRLSQQIKQGIYSHGVVVNKDKKIFAYEVDGFGQHRLYDDANLPSLLSLPYFQFIELNDEIYQNTRNFILSAQNKYFYQMGKIQGIGSSHTSVKSIWPLSLMTQILTSNSDEQIKLCLQTLMASAKNNLLHQSFYAGNPSAYTRQWFAWANSFFGETIVWLHENKKHLIQKL